MAYRTTPFQMGYSPLELLMCRKLRSKVPMTREQCVPFVPDAEMLKRRDQQIKDKQKKNMDQHHGARDTPPLIPESNVWIPGRDTGAQVQEEVAPRSYMVSTPEGSVIRRNRIDLLPLPESVTESETVDTSSNDHGGVHNETVTEVERFPSLNL